MLARTTSLPASLPAHRLRFRTLRRGYICFQPLLGCLVSVPFPCLYAYLFPAPLPPRMPSYPPASLPFYRLRFRTLARRYICFQPLLVCLVSFPLPCLYTYLLQSAFASLHAQLSPCQPPVPPSPFQDANKRVYISFKPLLIGLVSFPFPCLYAYLLPSVFASLHAQLSACQPTVPTIGTDNRV